MKYPSQLRKLKNKIHFTSLGCARNLVDTEVMLGMVLKAGYQITDQLDQADFLVINTCGFLASARQESIDSVNHFFQEKKIEAKVIVAGCMVQKHKEQLKERFPYIHYFLGSGDVEKILEAILADHPGEAVSNARSYLEWGEIPRQLSTPKHYAYLKIAEGCAKQCAFCIIPKIKGRLRSKSMPQILKEFRALISQGVKEVILIAQDLGDYGKDLIDKQGLESVISLLLSEKDFFWLRLLYLYPDEITDELIALMKADKRICSYLDMPIQHISNRILKAMKRKTSKEQIIDTIEKLRKNLPNVVIRTSLMVGFPSETEEEVDELIEFIQKHPIDHIGLFKYSCEEQSASAKLSDHIAEEVKQARFEKVAKAQMQLIAQRNQRYIGQKIPVIIEGTHPDSPYLLCGRFSGQAPEIDGMVIINDARKVKNVPELYEVEITDVADYDLIGRVIRSLGKKTLLNMVV
ncbi:30S ribosomal protein S12 methylthiotransferase RimO [Candidatus Rhabdochlamydia porcellionis]|jgi:ribosomal protein S12 methylthiotransferase|uniref:Ribosomal protein uS12 methylthiotransferase RimO n=1 Tax=Candidatus Rhabdochlamydia porcellionis TaxID=225148 RepID=A0ABX8YZM5_9BACT|nr:30S ribosomal protein S12 methylthiotransferase RimO [Candidatus Rhabdochlamydia porcellionis]QZA58845.1 Ribosomal protein S12 methylthiotransferase RimO [Candidatus Rhabdochlamydia porcellionis]